MANFNRQWIEIFATGTQIDNAGREHQITSDFLESVVRNYDPSVHEAPAVIGHPDDNAPAYGWASALRVRDGRLEAKFADVDPSFEEIVQGGRFKKRSASFYVDKATAPSGRAPYLRHVGFLGAQPPAVKGLRDIHFSEGESLTFESITFSEGDTSMDDKETRNFAERLIEIFKEKLGLGKKDDAPASPSFSEADLNAKITEAVKAATASFGEQIAALKEENKSLHEKVDRQTATTTRAELISFCEKLGAANCPPAFREMGLVEFMEAISGVEQKVTVINFEESDGKKVEKKEESTPLAWFKNFLGSLGPFIQFGEHFSSLVATGNDTATIVDPDRMNSLREKAGIETAKGGQH